MKTVLYLAIAFAVCVLPGRATGQQSEPTVSATISPVAVFAKVLLTTTEFRLGEPFSIAAVANVGELEGALYLAGGIQVIGYPIGDFSHGMQCGAELLFMHTDKPVYVYDGMIADLGDGVAISPFLGYKVSLSGFTINLQAGVSFIAGRSEPIYGSGGSTWHSTTETGLLMNVRAGWTF